MSGSAPASDPVIHILLALSDRPRHGYAIMAEVEDRTEGAVRLGTGTLYTALKRLRKDGLIREVSGAERSEHGRERRTYALTEQGQAYLAEQVERLRALVGHAVAKRTLPGPGLV